MRKISFGIQETPLSTLTDATRLQSDNAKDIGILVFDLGQSWALKQSKCSLVTRKVHLTSLCYAATLSSGASDASPSRP